MYMFCAHLYLPVLDSLEFLHHSHHVLSGFVLQLLMLGALVYAEQKITSNTAYVRRQQIVCQEEATSSCSK